MCQLKSSNAQGVRVRCAPASRGFTLVELLVAVSIVVVLVGIMVPTISGARHSARRASTATLINTVSTGINQFKMSNNRLPGYFSQDELGRASNQTGFTQMENALLELEGGLADASSHGGEGIISVTIAGRTATINTRAVGGSEGPGYMGILPRTLEPREAQANGIAPARPGVDQIPQTDSMGEMPDILDAWGRPLLLWTRNETAGRRPLFAMINAPEDRTATRAQFYWHSNHGYLAADNQRLMSTLGETIHPDRRVRTMHALLGDPGATDPASAQHGTQYIPSSPIGEFVVQSTGRDGVVLSNNGEVNAEFTYVPSGFRISGRAPSGDQQRAIRLSMERVDDIIRGGN